MQHKINFHLLFYGACFELCIGEVTFHLMKWSNNARRRVFSLGVGVRETTVSMQSLPVLVGRQIAMLGSLNLLACARHLLSCPARTILLELFVVLSIPVCPCLWACHAPALSASLKSPPSICLNLHNASLQLQLRQEVHSFPDAQPLVLTKIRSGATLVNRFSLVIAMGYSSVC